MKLTEENPDAAKSIAMRLGAEGVTVYLTRPALESLAARLLEISKAAPEECYEVHLNMDFSHFDAADVHISPPITFSDGRGNIITSMREAALKAAIDAGEVPADASLAPFEVTFMHVSRQAVQEEADLPDD